MTGTSAKPAASCPLSAGFNRLEEAHALWHQALECYERPPLFRANLNAAIQALRNVTWGLQAAKAEVTGFAAWYGTQQEQLRADPLMRWLVDSRNLVVKQGDLETASRARVSIVASYDGPKLMDEIDVPPGASTDDIAKVIGSVAPPGLPRDSTVLVERKWVAASLPGHELLDALGICYRRLVDVMTDAHARTVAHTCSISVDDGRSCMIRSDEFHTSYFDLTSRTPLHPEFQDVRVDPKDGPSILEKYGLTSTEPWPQSLREQAPLWLDAAQQILAKDGFHNQTLVLVRGNTRSIRILAPDNQQDKYLLWERIAAEVERDQIEGLVFISEVWIREADESIPGTIQGGAIRGEALQVLVATNDGDIRQLSCRFRKIEGRPVFDEPSEGDSSEARHFFLDPVRRAWERMKTGGST